MRYPYDWKKILPIGTDNNAITFTSSLESKSDLFRERVVIAVGDNHPTFHGFNRIDPIKYNQNLRYSKLIRSNLTITIGGNNHAQLSYWHAYTNDGIPLIVREIVLVKGDNKYYIDYIALESNYYKFLPTVQRL